MKEISISELNFNPVTMISNEWMLITAGTEESYNTMTASWGHIGSIWGHGSRAATSCVYLRPQRYTKEFVDREPLYTLSFFDPEYKNALGYLGSHSGRDEDKVAKMGLTPVFAGGKDGICLSEAVPGTHPGGGLPGQGTDGDGVSRA